MENPDFINNHIKKPFDIIISRATFSSVKEICQQKSLLSKKGRIVLIKGALDRSQIDQIKKDSQEFDLALLDLHTYHLPEDPIDRNIVIIG